MKLDAVTFMYSIKKVWNWTRTMFNKISGIKVFEINYKAKES